MFCLLSALEDGCTFARFREPETVDDLEGSDVRAGPRLIEQLN
jgi:hypothetical protein